MTKEKEKEKETKYGWVKWRAVSYGTGGHSWQYEEVILPFGKSQLEWFADDKANMGCWSERTYRIEVVKIKYPPKDYLIKLVEWKERETVRCTEAAKRYAKLAKTIKSKKKEKI